MSCGIKPKTNKENSRFEPIQNLPVPEEVILYTSQHIGAPSEVIVEKKQAVKKGQLVASPKGGCSAALHSSITGIVKDISEVNMCAGRSGTAVIIKKEKIQDQDKVLMNPLSSPDADKIIKRIAEAGIVGMGGAGFPTHVKISPPKPIDIAFLNGCECEPFLTADERVMTEENEKVVEGFALLKKAVGAEKGIIGIENDKPVAIEKISEAAAAYDNIEVKVLEKIYPQGYEKMLITHSTGREIPPGKLPFDIGVTVHNASTCLAVAEAVLEGKPLIERVLTVSGKCLPNPVNYRVPVGMPVSEVLKYCISGISQKGEFDVYMGGPMMGVSLDSLDYGVLKTTSGIIIQRPFFRKQAPCVKCGRCVDACPMGLYPQRLNMFYEGRDFSGMSETDLDSCMECGCCSYVCPSEIYLTEKFKEAKTHL